MEVSMRPAGVGTEGRGSRKKDAGHEGRGCGWDATKDNGGDAEPLHWLEPRADEADGDHAGEEGDGRLEDGEEHDAALHLGVATRCFQDGQGLLPGWLRGESVMPPSAPAPQSLRPERRRRRPPRRRGRRASAASRPPRAAATSPSRPPRTARSGSWPSTRAGRGRRCRTAPGRRGLRGTRS